MVKIFKVSGQSMLPTLADGQYIIGESLAYKFHNPKIGDIVVLKSPDNISLIKRIADRKSDKYFVEGDNKKESKDSRHFGPVEINKISAKIIYL